MQVIMEKFVIHTFVKNIEQVEISALKKKGFRKVFSLVNKIIRKSKKNFTTSMLNRLLEKFTTIKK